MKTLDERFWSKVDRRGPDECWAWTASVDAKGYGRIAIGRSATPAHRVAHQLAIGPVDADLQVDHVCHTRDDGCPGGNGCTHRRCVNPSHLEAVTAATNTRRALAGRLKVDRCSAGHEYTPENTRPSKASGGRVHRKCRECERARDRKRQSSPHRAA